MASSTTIDSNQLEDSQRQEQEQEHHVGQLLRREAEKQQSQLLLEDSVAVSATDLMPTISSCKRNINAGVLALEEQLLIELKKLAACAKVKDEGEQKSVELSQIELVYLAEGNANLVLSLPQFKKVLRLPKSNHKQQQLLSKPHAAKLEVAGEEDDGVENREEYENTSVSTNVQQNAKELTMQDFVAYMKIIQKLVGREYVLTAEIVSILNEFDRQWINAQIREQRPAIRLDKEFHGQYGLLLPDATLLPTALEGLLADLHPSGTLVGDVYAVEIKTKQGWLLPSYVNNLFDITASSSGSATTVAESSVGGSGCAMLAKVDTRCRYCTMQFLKLKTQKIQVKSAYCPINLFSGHAMHMLKALDALFECPQNNLRLYKSGRLIYGDHASTLSYEQLKEQLASSDMELQLLKQLLMVCLLRDYTKPYYNNKSDKMLEGCDTTAIATVIAAGQLSFASGCSTEESTQSSVMPEETTEPEMTQATQTSQQRQINEAETQCLPKNCVLQQILHLQLLAKRHLSSMLDSGFGKRCEKTYDTLQALLKREDICHMSSSALWQNLNAAEQYMLGATALDCSIIITLQQVCNLSAKNSDWSHIIELSELGKTYISKVSMIDLDPKADNHLHKYLKQTKEAIAIALHQFTEYGAEDTGQLT